MRGPFAVLLAGMMVLACAEPQAAEQPAPKNLEECYLQVAMQKSTADMAYLAKELCEAVFKKAPTSIVVLEAQSGQCVEWWFDARGRFESPAHYCALEQPSAGRINLACEWKTSNNAATYVELKAQEGRLVPTSPLRGKDPGPLFVDLATCVRHKTRAVETSTR